MSRNRKPYRSIAELRSRVIKGMRQENKTPAENGRMCDYLHELERREPLKCHCRACLFKTGLCGMTFERDDRGLIKTYILRDGRRLGEDGVWDLTNYIPIDKMNVRVLYSFQR